MALTALLQSAYAQPKATQYRERSSISCEGWLGRLFKSAKQRLFVQTSLEVDRHLHSYNILWIILLRCEGQVTTSLSFGFLYNGDNARYPVLQRSCENQVMYVKMHLVYWIIATCSLQRGKVFSTTRQGILTLFSIVICFEVSTPFGQFQRKCI